MSPHPSSPGVASRPLPAPTAASRAQREDAPSAPPKPEVYGVVWRESSRARRTRVYALAYAMFFDGSFRIRMP
jgi:hypothetical protein